MHDYTFHYSAYEWPRCSHQTMVIVLPIKCPVLVPVRSKPSVCVRALQREHMFNTKGCQVESLCQPMLQIELHNLVQAAIRNDTLNTYVTNHLLRVRIAVKAQCEFVHLTVVHNTMTMIDDIAHQLVKRVDNKEPRTQRAARLHKKVISEAA